MPRSFRLPLIGVAVVTALVVGLTLRSLSSMPESLAVAAVEVPEPPVPAAHDEPISPAIQLVSVGLREDLMTTLTRLRQGKQTEQSFVLSDGTVVALRTFKDVQGLEVGGGVALGEVVGAPGTLARLEYGEDRLTGSVQWPDRHEVWTLELGAEATGSIRRESVHDDLRCALCDADGTVAMSGEGTR